MAKKLLAAPAAASVDEAHLRAQAELAMEQLKETIQTEMTLSEWAEECPALK